MRYDLALMCKPSPVGLTKADIDLLYGFVAENPWEEVDLVKITHNLYEYVGFKRKGVEIKELSSLIKKIEKEEIPAAWSYTAHGKTFHTYRDGDLNFWIN